MSNKLKKLESLLTLVDESITKDEFVQSFELVLKAISDLKQNNDTEWSLIHAAFQMLESKLREKVNILAGESNSLIQTTNAESLSAIKVQVETRLNAALASFTTSVDSLTREQQQMMNYLYDKVTLLEPGKPGDPGLDADEAAITAKLLGEFQPKFEAEIARMREELLKMGGTSKVGWGAHPLTIAQSGTTKSKTTRHINFKGTGVSSVVRNPDGTVDVTLSGGGGGGGGTLTSETPVGTVDGVNKVFTVSNTPVQVFNSGALQTAGGVDYTLSGLTITFVSAPTSDPASILSSWYFSSVAQGTPIGEVPSGTVNSVNVTFTLAHIPSPASSLQLQLGRQPQIQGTDYTLSGATITYTTAPNILLVGQHYAYYFY